MLADAELIHRLAERAGDRIARKVCFDDGDVDAGGRSFRHASDGSGAFPAGHPRFGG
jgi:hypothetical protein